MEEQDFWNSNFEKDDDPMFPFRKRLISEQDAEENGIPDDEIPCLLYGSTGINKGFCIYTGEHFIWLNSNTVEDAVKIAETIVAFEVV